ncbi:hypothetical protein [Halosimplex pelagicum]|uniref:Uncharacterized protein n=1 Tax=Halosimplex pelagicum TaxID=869886 RepID=A0A7D5P8M9_9EURY|nr:hypothetical protein [Halosimplex pelagicum]QLH82001.1 hypothetical protein HZS54_10385 [Halosimplex pelagicum]
MINNGSEIVCRRCEEDIPRNADRCPHCGASIRGVWGAVIAVAFGLLLLVGSLFEIGSLWPYALFGALAASGGGYLLWNRQQRIQAAGSKKA